MDPTTRCQKLQRSTTDPDYNEQNAKEKHPINQITRDKSAKRETSTIKLRVGNHTILKKQKNIHH